MSHASQARCVLLLVMCCRKAKGIEFLVCDALAAAKDELNLAEAADDVKQFLALDDGLLRTLQLMNPDRCEHSAGVRKVRGLQYW